MPLTRSLSWTAAFMMTVALSLVWAADTTVVVSGVHQCCGGCANRITDAVTSAGATCKVENTKSGIYPDKRGTVTIIASGDAIARKAVEALAAKGFHGRVEPASFKMPDDSGVKMDGSDTVSKLDVSGAHVCCNKCTKALALTVKKVSGVTGNTIRKGEPNFSVSGSFKAQELVKALNDAGFHVKVTK